MSKAKVLQRRGNVCVLHLFIKPLCPELIQLPQLLVVVFSCISQSNFFLPPGILLLRMYDSSGNAVFHHTARCSARKTPSNRTRLFVSKRLSAN